MLIATALLGIVLLELHRICDISDWLTKLDQLVKSRFIELFDSIKEQVPLSYYIAALSAGKSLAGEEECAVYR